MDGNAIAGALFEYFGDEMTTAHGTCRHCWTPSQIGELRVYMRAPGAVVRCRVCGNVVMVLVRIRDVPHIDHSWFTLTDRTVGFSS